ncbi:NADPH:quinone reductase-like Zn-dependent oxidoreductase [Actinoplanes lutulentus]|uniref:NADPH:quinone reductase-like Zn-dependent oxidoreductase n=1 Tax=Actinoplanes lutulentus TaxID=1287878 RepID=A0A327ZCA0_9ACTN|nr:zinc-binding dehydrogenase [Actinoplanes lutulentus]MBB2946200.1 NADPH:quinone reductase-like Zn-dependent oxidoreductase [Actinoplanes lutulentus]RAK32889.1 NADPH:quinone reductase-like Zn-dependent oxidoreductase [Actinoplanes lutulentus]
MRAAYASALNPDEPLRGLTVGDLPERATPDGWVPVEVRASSLNHHDLWSLRGVGLPADRLPMILGCDAAGVDPDGNEVVVFPVVEDKVDPRGFSIFSERHPGGIAERIAAPRENLIAKPAGVSFAEAACLPTAWLTAYHMLVTRGRIAEGGSVLVQGAGGGVATAAVAIGVALGKRVYATSREQWKRERISELGATALEPGARLPERVDVVIESVGEPTFDHSMKCAAPGARIVVCGATAGHKATIDLRRVFAMRIEILGSSMGTPDELAALLQLVADSTVRPVIDSTHPFSEAAKAFERLDAGEVFGKVVIDHLA